MVGKKFLNGRVSRFEFLTSKKEISLLIVLQLEKLNIEWQDMQIIQKLKRDCLHLGDRKFQNPEHNLNEYFDRIA